jgi:hypothetical protein
MKFLVNVILIAILSALAAYVLPWWTVAIVAFFVSFMAKYRPSRSFLLGFCGVGLCWLVAALWHDIPNDHILSTRMAKLFHLPSYVLFMAVTVLLGALIGGLSAWAASLFTKTKQ